MKCRENKYLKKCAFLQPLLVGKLRVQPLSFFSDPARGHLPGASLVKAPYCFVFYWSVKKISTLPYTNMLFSLKLILLALNMCACFAWEQFLIATEIYYSIRKSLGAIFQGPPWLRPQSIMCSNHQSLCLTPNFHIFSFLKARVCPSWSIEYKSSKNYHKRKSCKVEKSVADLAYGVFKTMLLKRIKEQLFII